AIHGCAVRIRIERQNLLNRRILGQTKDVDLGITEIDLHWIATLAAEREIAGFKVMGGHETGIRKGGIESVTVVVREPESLIVQQRPSGGDAKRVAGVGILGHDLSRRIGLMVEIVARAQSVETPEPVNVGVKSVGAALAYDVNHRARVAAKLGKKIAGDDAKFLNRIRVQGSESRLRQRQTGNVGVVIIGAIQQKVVVALPRTID